MKIFKTVDEKLREKGYVLIEENRFGAIYRKTIEKSKYNSRIDITHKADGNHIIQSFEENLNKDGLNNVVGLTYDEIKLIMKKYKQLSRKYDWY